MTSKKEAIVGKVIMGTISAVCAVIAFCLRPKDETLIDVESEVVMPEPAEVVAEEVTEE